MLKDKTMVKKLHSGSQDRSYQNIYQKMFFGWKVFKKNDLSNGCPVVFQQAKLFQNKKF